MTKTEALLAQMQALPDAEQQEVVDFAEFLAQKVRRQQETRCIERYQRGEISVGKLGELLGLESRWDAEAFLRQHNIPLNYDEVELAKDVETIQRLEGEEGLHRGELLGAWRGKVWMAEDFDAPLEEFEI